MKKKKEHTGILVRFTPNVMSLLNDYAKRMGQSRTMAVNHLLLMQLIELESNRIFLEALNAKNKSSSRK